MKGIVNKINEVYALLEDDWSKKIFENRIRFPYVCECSSECGGIMDGYQFYETSRIPEVERRFGKEEKFVITGAGEVGKLAYTMMKHAGYHIEYFVDTNKQFLHTKVNGLEVISFEELCMEHRDLVVVIAEPRNGEAFYQKLIDYGYPEDRIVFSKKGKLTAHFGNEYFDLPVHRKGKKEIFFDIGCFDGAECERFIKWCEGEYDRIYAIEPVEESCVLAKNNLSKYQNIELMNIALGEKTETMSFHTNKKATQLSKLIKTDKVGSNSVLVRSVDEILDGKEATFIKMDVEGVEGMVLKGAEKTICKYKPTLAIAIYHNERDILDIPVYLASLNVGYKFYLRHYKTTITSVVLYCV